MKSAVNKKSFSSKGIFPHQWAFTLLIPLRNLFLSPNELIRRLALQPGMFVLEVGPGPGYFSLPVARFLEKGKLVLADIQPEMLQKAKKRLEKRAVRNADYLVCNGEKFNLPDNYFERIFMVTVLGEVENKDIYVAEFYRMLKPGGILSVSEQAGDPDKLTIEETKELALLYSFTFSELFGNTKNYTINFIK
jgi:ubiquinone/menaquinone biosynthesis C-methylase UbiE